jgi:hypothetical protein
MTIEGDGADAITEIATHFGEATKLPKDVTITERTHALPPDYLMQHLSLSEAQIESHSAPKASRGIGESGVRSGTDRQIISSQAAVRFQYANEAFCSGIATVLSKCARIQKNVIPGDIHVWAKTPNDEFDVEINKDDLKEPFTFFVEFTDISPEDEYRRHDDLIRMVNGRIYTSEYAREQLPNVDADEINRQERKAIWRNSEIYQSVLMQTASALLSQKISALQEVQNIQEQPTSSISGTIEEQSYPQPEEKGSMTATTPKVAVPGSPEAMALEMKKLQSNVPMSATQGQGGGGNWRS